MDFIEIGWEDADWLQQAQYRDQWRDVVNMVMDPQVPQMTEFLD
jgi:hypothetical protein